MISLVNILDCIKFYLLSGVSCLNLWGIYNFIFWSINLLNILRLIKLRSVTTTLVETSLDSLRLINWKIHAIVTASIVTRFWFEEKIDCAFALSYKAGFFNFESYWCL